MENPKQENAVQIGNTTFYVTSVFSGTVQLEYLIKLTNQKEIEQENNYPLIEKTVEQIAEKSA